MRKGARFQSGAPVQPTRKRTLGVSSRQSGSSAVPAAIKIKERRTDQADINARRGTITLPYRAYNVRTLICIRVAFLPASSASKQWTEPDGHAITSQKEHPLCRARYKLHFFRRDREIRSGVKFSDANLLFTSLVSSFSFLNNYEKARVMTFI